MKIKAGKNWSLDVKVVGREGDIVTVNINKGAMFAFKMYNGVIMQSWYDGVGGPPVRDWGKLYIWNSKELSTTGKRKMDFTVSKKDMEDIINEQIS